MSVNNENDNMRDGRSLFRYTTIDATMQPVTSTANERKAVRFIPLVFKV